MKINPSNVIFTLPQPNEYIEAWIDNCTNGYAMVKLLIYAFASTTVWSICPWYLGVDEWLHSSSYSDVITNPWWPKLDAGLVDICLHGLLDGAGKAISTCMDCSDCHGLTKPWALGAENIWYYYLLPPACHCTWGRREGEDAYAMIMILQTLLTPIIYTFIAKSACLWARRDRDPVSTSHKTITMTSL